MPTHDIRCADCGLLVPDFFLPLPWPDAPELRHFEDGGKFEIRWSARVSDQAWHPSSSVTVFENPRTGEIVYPGKNSAPMPARYRQQGYIKREMRSIREVDKFERAQGVVNEAMHYDRNGKADRVEE